MWLQESMAYFYTGLYVLVLIHNWQNGLHAAVFHKVWFIPHKDQRYPATKTYITTLHQYHRKG